MKHRPPGFLSLEDELDIDPRYFKLLLCENPRHIIDDEPIPHPGYDFFTTEEGYR